jgi:uncharacterized peroxidase-related enzyme
VAHIEVPSGMPGIRGLLLDYPRTGTQLSGLAEALLCGPSSLTRGERELIATFVSATNECHFCSQSHAAAARELLAAQKGLVDSALAERDPAGATPRLRVLLRIAGKVARDGRLVFTEDVSAAREAGADDQAIHDTVLIAAAFCMYNRYVDGLATWAPHDPAAYRAAGEALARFGYVGTIEAMRELKEDTPTESSPMYSTSAS